MAVAIFLLVLPAGWAGAEAPATAGESSVEESWYRIEMAGAPAGWLRERIESRAGELTSESVMHLKLRRSDAELRLELASRFVERADGRPLRAWTEQKLGAMPVETTWEFAGDAVVVRHRQGAEVKEERQPWPAGEWLTPGQVEVRVREMLRRGVEEFSYQAVDPQLGLMPVTSAWKLLARDEEIAAEGGPYLTTRWRQTQSYAPQMPMIIHLDPDGRMIRSTAQMAGMELVLTLASREAAELPLVAPELLVRSLIASDRPIPEPRRVRRARYELSVAEGELPALPAVGNQRVVRRGSRAVVTVEVGSSPEVGEVDVADFLRASTWVDHEDERIRELLQEALGEGGDDPGERAETLRAFVRDYLTEKDLRSILATATEVAATRSGDCTEHAVLLTALLRAAGIPARVVSGVVYTEHFAGRSSVFAYHMWTQALVAGRWVDLDAIMPEPFDATHVALATTALNDDGSAFMDMAAIVPIIGQLRIRVLEVGSR